MTRHVGAMNIERIETDEAPAAGGHYSQGVVHDGTLYVSGQLPIDPATGERCLGPIEEQALVALGNVAAIVRAAGADLEHVLKVNIFLADGDDWGRVNRVYADFFGEHRPARAVIPVNTLHYGFGIEIDAVAAVP
jgi:2-iminobutanoate/2-iminopropanoate deaminase